MLKYLGLVLILVGCGKPLPEDKKDYAGLWSNAEKTYVLSISPDSKVNYFRREGSTTTRLNFAISGFEGNSFKVGLWKFQANFEVKAPPYEKDGQQVFEIDGETLVRVPLEAHKDYVYLFEDR